MSNELSQLQQALDVTQGTLAAKTLRASELSAKIEAITTAFRVFANLLNTTDSGRWAWDEMSNDMQEAWNELCEAVRA